MLVESCSIEGVKILKPKIFGDHRGYFVETYNDKVFEELTGTKTTFIQDNESLSSYGTLRGLHFQKPPYTQAKLVRAVTGIILDVVVDLRKESPTFGHWHSEILSEENKTQLFVPKGFGHGFAVLSETSIFAYKVDNYYNADSDDGIMWDDADLKIDWQLETESILLSAKDKSQQSFSDYKDNSCF